MDQVYEKIKHDTRQQFEGKQLSLVIDESTDISQNRLLNTSIVLLDSQSYTWDTVEAEEGAQTTERILEEVVDIATNITYGQLEQIVSLSTDTCETMQCLWSKANKDTRTKHWITAPCDSHGIQLLIKDILMIKPIEQFWKTAIGVIGAFKSAISPLSQ